MALKCLGAFVPLPVCVPGSLLVLSTSGTLPITSSILLLWLELVHSNHLGWHLLRQKFSHVHPIDCFSKKAK